MDAEIRAALDNDRVIDITTTGRCSGTPRRTEIWYFRADGRYFITGAPGPERNWYRNMVANPRFVFHLKQTAKADLQATARPVTDDGERESVLRAILVLLVPGFPQEWMPGSDKSRRDGSSAMFERIQADLEGSLMQWMPVSPLVEVQFAD